MSGVRIPIRRADDLLICDLELFGLEIQGQPPNRMLVRSPGTDRASLVLHLPSQHIVEQMFWAHELPMEPVVVPTRAAFPSRVAFLVPDDALPIAYQLPTLLGLLTRCQLSVVETADYVPPATHGGYLAWIFSLLNLFLPPALVKPAPDQTAIELPYRLILSPPSRAGFSHTALPEASAASNRISLWHSRLGLQPGTEGAEDDADERQLRAVWLRRGDGPDWSPTDPKLPDADVEEPFLTPMTQLDRANIVHLSGNPRLRWQTDGDIDPRPISTRRLALTSLGAWLTSRGDWDPPPHGIDLVEWTHRATQGRDQFVRIVKIGFLFPFGHPAAKIEITERKFASDLPGDSALLHHREFIVVRDPVRTYLSWQAPPGRAHTMPLQTVELRTLVTPDLEIPPAGKDTCFLVRPAGSQDPFQFKLRGLDRDGNTVDLQSPLVFLLSSAAWDTNTIAQAKVFYDGGGPPSSRPLSAHGSSIALAPGLNGDATYPCYELVFSARPADPMPDQADDPSRPGFWPELVRASVRAPALQILTGQGDARTVEYHDAYKTHGLGGDNRGEIVVRVTGGAKELDFGAKGDRSGALLQPNMSVGGISRQLGPVGGAKLDEVAAANFDPKNFFAGAQARLFGVFSLGEVLARITGATGTDMPRIVTEQTGNHLKAVISWRPIPQSYPPTDSKFVTNSSTVFDVTATIEASGPAPTSVTEARIEHFELHLVPPARFLELDFDRVTFKAEAGRKPDIDVVLRKVRFVGVLSFVERLRELIPIDGFSDPPALEVTPSGITSSFSMALPDLAVGVFSLQNLRLGAGFAVPFQTGPLTVRFSFCERENPFCLTVSMFGGGGFFALAIDPDGVQVMEAALEFGASVSVDLGVASGGVHVMAGIYFKIESGKGVTLSGYFRLGGNMSVLGIVSVSVELYLSLTYEEASGKATGRATLTVEIEIFLFSASVDVTCERKFAGSASDPSFHGLMAPYEDADFPGVIVHPWQEYCAAYA